MRKQKKMIKEKNKESLKAHLRVIFCAVIIAASAAIMISRGVELNETETKISKLEKQLAEAEAVTCQKTFELENSIDLKTIEDTATTKLAMQRPEKYQTIYINVGKSDITEVTAKDVEGAENKLKNTVDAFVENIIGIFSIN